MALLSRAALDEGRDARELEAARERVLAESDAATRRRRGDGTAADLAQQAATGRPRPGRRAWHRGATAAQRRRADAALADLQPAARSFSDRADAAADARRRPRRPAD